MAAQESGPNRYETRRSFFSRLFWMICLVCIFSACSPLEEDEFGYASDESDLEDTKDISSEAIIPGQELEGACDFADDQPITDFSIYDVPTIREPQPRTVFYDPVFLSCLIRVTDRDADILPGDNSKGLKNEYSRVQSFNADGSRLLAYSTDGNWYLYDVLSLQPLGQIPIWHEPRWDSDDPDLLYYSEDTRLMSYRISNGQQEVIHNFAEDFPQQNLAAVWMKYEGSPSMNSRYWGLMAEDQDWMTVALLVYDLQSDSVISKRFMQPAEIDSVTISPLGQYFVAYYDNYCEHGQLGSDDQPCGLMVYDRDLKNGRGLLRIVGHSDLAIDVHGNEVLIYQDIDTDTISMVELSSGRITPLQAIDFSYSAIGLHFSGRAFQTPGWAVVSTSNGSDPSSTWMDDQIFAIELVKDGQVVRLAHTHSIYSEDIDHDYWAEPHASVNQDLTKIVFTSNWGRAGTDEVDLYMIFLPENWIASLP